MTSARALALFSQAADTVMRAPAAEAYQTIEAAMAELVGFKLMTILRLNEHLLQRLHTSDPASYATGGAKDISGDAWLRSMLGGGVPIISRDEAAVKARFFDHEAIFGLGCGSVLNLPVTSPHGTLGSLNLLHQAHWFKARHVPLVRPFVALLAVLWLAEGMAANP